jgi:hypothetical protein
MINRLITGLLGGIRAGAGRVRVVDQPEVTVNSCMSDVGCCSRVPEPPMTTGFPAGADPLACGLVLNVGAVLWPQAMPGFARFTKLCVIHVKLCKAGKGAVGGAGSGQEPVYARRRADAGGTQRS